jgi:UDP-N-acetylmuramoylalanine--D-glutamate ligase
MTLDLSDQRVVVVGLGTSGVAACRLALGRGARVVGTDAKKDVSPAARSLEGDGVRLVLGGHEAARLDEEFVLVLCRVFV